MDSVNTRRPRDPSKYPKADKARQWLDKKVIWLAMYCIEREYFCELDTDEIIKRSLLYKIFHDVEFYWFLIAFLFNTYRLMLCIDQLCGFIDIIIYYLRTLQWGMGWIQTPLFLSTQLWKTKNRIHEN